MWVNGDLLQVYRIVFVPSMIDCSTFETCNLGEDGVRAV